MNVFKGLEFDIYYLQAERAKRAELGHQFTILGSNITILRNYKYIHYGDIQKNNKSRHSKSKSVAGR